MDRLGIPRDKPILLQVARFDRFKDPVGTIAAYRMVKKHFDCRLILAGGGVANDPEGEAVLADVKTAVGPDSDIHVLQLPPEADSEINALQRAATIVLQKSIKEGFGLGVSEAMWKGKPVVGGTAGGIADQIIDGVTGYTVHSIEGAAFRVRHLLNNPRLDSSHGRRSPRACQTKLPDHASPERLLDALEDIHALMTRRRLPDLHSSDGGADDGLP